MRKILVLPLYLAAWLKRELCQLGVVSTMRNGFVEKLSGDNTKEEKERVMDLFKSGYVK